MNERILELREQAWALVSDEERDRGELYETRVRWERCDQKFAELIVRECLNQLQQTAPPDITSEKLQGVVNSAHRYAIDVSGANIKEHFGVEL